MLEAQVSEQETFKPTYEKLLADKAEKLQDLMRRKPSQKHYKHSLKAFLDADAKAEKALLAHLEEIALPMQEQA
jgi:hypothetical protein